jgi:hypothetical protein
MTGVSPQTGMIFNLPNPGGAYQWPCPGTAVSCSNIYQQWQANALRREGTLNAPITLFGNHADQLWIYQLADPTADPWGQYTNYYDTLLQQQSTLAGAGYSNDIQNWFVPPSTE